MKEPRRMFHLTKPAYLLVLVSTLVVSTAAQNVPRETTAHEKRRDASTSVDGGNQNEVLSLGQRRALWLLVQLFEQAKGCDDETFSIRMQTDIADLLWKYDEARARLQFEEAFHAIETMKPEPKIDPPDSRFPPEYSFQYQLRQEVLELIAHHDSDWARKLGRPADTDQSTHPDSIALDGERKANQTVGPAQTVSTGTISQLTASGVNVPLKLSLMMKSFGPADIPDLLKRAEMVPNTAERDSLYARAARQVLVGSDFERALSITEKISPGPARENLEAIARQRAAIAALSKGDFVAADHYVRDLPNLVQRATVYDQMLRAFQKRNDVGRAAEVLTEAEKSFGKAKDGPDKALALLIIAGAAARIDPLRGFDFLELAIVAINHAGPASTSRGADGRTDLDSDSLHFDQVLPLLAGADLDRVLQLAQSIDNKEFSVLAQLAICRGLLAQLRATQ